MKKEKSDLLQGTLDLLVMRILHAGAANGWEITQRIHVVSKEVLTVNYGSLYPALYRLEAKGWVTSEWGESENNRRAKFYKLTASGQKQLEAERKSWESLSNAVDLILRKA